MPQLIRSGANDIFNRNFLNKEFTCPSTRNTYRIVESDRSTFAERQIGQGRDDTTAYTILCPDCGSKVYPGGGHMPNRHG